MKPVYLLLLLVVLMPHRAEGQLSGGFYGGFNSSKLRGDTPKDMYFRSLPSGDLGVFLDWKVKDLFVVSFQPYYTRKGTKVSFRLDKDLDLVDSAKIFLSYLSFPVVLKVMTDKKRWYILGGLETAIPVRSYLKYTRGSDEKIDISEDVTGINFYLHFGVGHRWPVGENKVIFGEFRYSQALINITRNNSVDPAYVSRVRSRGLQLSAGIEFSLFQKKTGK